MSMSMSQIIAAAWDEVMLTSPSPLHEDSPLILNLLGLPVPLYCDYILRPRRNILGNPIPRITLVRRNLTLLQNKRLPAIRLP